MVIAMRIKCLNRIVISLVSALLLFILLGVLKSNAVTGGSFKMGFEGPSTASRDSIISVSVIIKDMTEGVSGAGASLNYDSSYLELIDKENGDAMSISYNNENPAKFLGVSIGSSVMLKSTLVTYRFKALRAGTTSITLSELSSTNIIYQSMNITPEVYTVTITDAPQVITSVAYGHTITDDYITTVALNTTGIGLKNQLDNANEYLEIWDANNQNRIDDSSNLSTGMIVKLIVNGDVKDQKQIVIRGETTGDGIVNVADAFRVIQHVLENDALSGSFLVAGETTGDDIVNVADAFRIIQHALDNDPFVWFGGN